MKTGLLMLLAILLIGCGREGIQQTERIYLRQIKTGYETTTKASGSFFIVFGSYHSETITDYKLRALGKYHGEYRFVDLDINRVSFKLDSSVTTPYIVVEYEEYQPYEDSWSFYNLFQSQWTISMNKTKYVITCHPDLVPEQLSQVKL
jgi:hypothetical protein